jgi:hypothetical protein
VIKGETNDNTQWETYRQDRISSDDEMVDVVKATTSKERIGGIILLTTIEG